MAAKFRNLKPIPVCKKDKVPPLLLDREGFLKSFPHHASYVRSMYFVTDALAAVICPKCKTGNLCRGIDQFYAYKDALDTWSRDNS